MTVPQTPVSAPSVVGAEPGPTPGRFDRLPLYVALVVRPDDDPLPKVEMSGAIPALRFQDAHASLVVQLSGNPRSQSAWLSALGAELTALARQIEEEDR